MTLTDLITAVLGVVLSLAFSFVPGLRDWFQKLTPDQKRGVMALTLLVIALGIFAGSCAGLWDTVTCTKSGALGLVSALIFALMANQTTYQIVPQPKPTAPLLNIVQSVVSGSAVNVGGNVQDSKIASGGGDVKQG